MNVSEKHAKEIKELTSGKAVTYNLGKGDVQEMKVQDALNRVFDILVEIGVEGGYGELQDIVDQAFAELYGLHNPSVHETYYIEYHQVYGTVRIERI